jgi:hypothetical protein
MIEFGSQIVIVTIVFGFTWLYIQHVTRDEDE